MAKSNNRKRNKQNERRHRARCEKKQRKAKKRGKVVKVKTNDTRRMVKFAPLYEHKRNQTAIHILSQILGRKVA